MKMSASKGQRLARKRWALGGLECCIDTEFVSELRRHKIECVADIRNEVVTVFNSDAQSNQTVCNT